MDLIVAVDQNWAIGKDGEQLLYLSQDLKRFKALTLGHAVISGPQDLSTFPGGRPLKGRRQPDPVHHAGLSPRRAVRSIPPWTPSSPPLRRMPLSSAGSPSTAPFWTGAAPPMSLRSWPSTPQTGTSRTWMPTLAGSRWRSQNSWRRTEYASGM